MSVVPKLLGICVTNQTDICILYRTDWIAHILRRNCLLKHVIEGKLGG
jgi:hypothetical protein